MSNQIEVIDTEIEIVKGRALLEILQHERRHLESQLKDLDDEIEGVKQDISELEGGAS